MGASGGQGGKRGIRVRNWNNTLLRPGKKRKLEKEGSHILEVWGDCDGFLREEGKKIRGAKGSLDQSKIKGERKAPVHQMGSRGELGGVT